MERCGYGLDDRYAILGRGNDENFSLHHWIQTSSGDPSASYTVCTGVALPGIQRPGREADHSPPPNAEVKMSGVIPPFLQCVFMTLCLINLEIRLYGTVLS
jgi:hypothetical protein